MAYGDFKDLAKRTAFDKVLRDKVFDITENPKYHECQRGPASMVYKFFDKKSRGTGVNTPANKSSNNKIKQNLKLAEKLHKPIIRNF